jgi:hypothetical protein
MDCLQSKGFTKVELLVVIVVLLAIRLPFYDAVSDSPYRARDITCKSNLHQIVLAVLSYRAAHQHGMPPGLKSLLPLLGSRAVFLCPVTEGGYTYRFINQPHAENIICWDSNPHQPNHSIFVWLNQERRNVLYADGKVGTVSEGQFKRLRLRGVRLTLVSSSVRQIAVPYQYASLSQNMAKSHEMILQV